MTEEKWLQDNLFDFENEGEKKNTPPEETKDSGEEKKGKNTDDFRVPPEGENPYFDKYFAEHHLRVNPIRARLLREAVETLSRNRDTPPSNEEIINWAVNEDMRRNPPETLRKFEEDRIREQFEKDLEKIQKHRENTYKEWLKDTSSTITTLKPKKEATNWMLERELYEIDLEEKMRQDREDKDEGAD